MPEKDTKGTGTGAAAKDEEAKAADEPVTYPRERLIAESGVVFDQPPHVVAGALSTGRAKQKVNFTTSEAERLVENFLAHEVETDHVKED